GTVQLCYASVDPLRNRRKGLIRTTEGITGDGISSHPDQQLELRFGHLITGAQLTGTDPGEALSDPPTGWCTLLGVVARQRGRERPVTITSSDSTQEVCVTVTRAHNTHRNRHRYRLLNDR